MRNLYIFSFIILFGNFIMHAQNDGDDISFGTYRIIQSKILNEDRTVLVHLPKDYEKSEKDYPVVYMLYGNHTFTYFAEVISVIETFGSDGVIPPMILVAVTNTDRYRDLLPLNRDGSKSGIDKFIGFFESELFNFVEKTYRTKDFRILIGPQAGANFALYTLFKKPDLFDVYIINNPFRWSSGRDLLMQMSDDYLNNNDSSKQFLFITHDNSDEFEIKGNKYIDIFKAKVNNNNREGFTLVTNHLPDSKDFTSPIGFKKGVKTYFKNYKFPEDKEVGCLNDIKTYYNLRSQEYGYPVDIPGHVLTMRSDKLLSQGKTNEAMEIMEYMIENKSQAENAYWRLANMSYKEGELKKAEKYLAEMIKLLGSDIGLVKGRYNKIVKMINESAVYEIDQDLKASGLRVAKKTYMKLKISGNKYFDEEEINMAGSRYLEQKKIKEALFIFKINVEQFPKSYKVYMRYGDALLACEKKNDAIINYKRSLEIDPENIVVKEKLKQLDEK